MENRSVRVVTVVLCATTAILIALATASSHAQVPLPDISPAALAQIDALINEKAARTGVQQKLDSQLVYELKMAQGETIAPGVTELATDLSYAPDYRLELDAKADVTDALLAQLRAMGIEIVIADAAGGTLRLFAYLTEVESIAELADVQFLQPKQRAMTSLPSSPGQGSRASEGELTHRAFAARGTFHADGSGVKIGVLSDGVTSLAASQASGDLGPVTVLPGQAGSGDEGTAMLEIIHDLAPGAQLYFATAFNGITSFANNIRGLRAAGCDIIVDDVFYYVESPFQDGQTSGVVSNTNGGVVIQAVKDVTASGALYFSSAGNSGNKNNGTSGTWEGDFSDGGATVPPLSSGHRLHVFGSQAYDVMTSAGFLTNLYWSDPLGRSSNDYDLFRLNSAGTAVLASSTNLQSGTQDPYEQIGAGSAGDRIVIVRSATAANRFLHLATNRGMLSISTAGEIHGHAATANANAFGVAATPALTAYPAAFTSASVVEWFSSDGPRRMFFTGDGTSITADLSSTGGQLLNKPDITAADGVTVSGAGGFPSPFYGTSAAAPHAGAIAALVKSANSSLTPAQIRSALVNTAIDIETAGVDRNSGAGIVMAFGAMQSVAAGTAFLTAGTSVASENPGNGNGAINAGEGAKMIVPLTNLGVAAATGIVGTLTTSTPGVTITQPAQAAYPDLAAGATASATPFLFTMASNAPCPLIINFTLTLTYAGGPSPFTTTFQVQTGPPPFTITTTLDGTAPAGAAGVSTSTGTQIGRLLRDGTVSSCAAPKEVPSIFDATGSRQYDLYSFNTCSENVASCATVTLSGSNAGSLFTAAYAPSFNPGNLQQSYKGDPGSSGVVSYSVGVPGGSQTMAVAVHELNPGGAFGRSYTLSVSGICAGACATPNQLPVARAKNVTVAAGPGGTANASIDDGSFDADGDPLTITQSPAGPYTGGTTSVLLTVVDPKGATSQATGNVTVTALPLITTQPQSQTIAPGLTASLSVVAQGTAPLTFQWFIGTSGTTTDPIVGATSSSFTTPGLVYTERYWVRVSNGLGTADSITAVITRPLSIATSSPWPTATAGVSYSLTLAATGGRPPYAWTEGTLNQWGETTLPSGLLLNSATGEIAGTPAAAGTFSVVMRVTGADAVFTQQTFAFTVNAVVDPLLDQEWYLKDRAVEIGAANVRPIWSTTRGAGVVIGVVDDGVQGTHPDLQANYVGSLSHDFRDHDADPSPVTSGPCAAGADCRGTSVAGIAAARGDNSIGISGVAPLAWVAGIRLAPQPTDADLAAALGHQLASVAIENHSWHRADDGQTLAAPGPLSEAALTSAVATGRGGKGRVFVWAAGDGRASGDNCNFDGYANSRFGIAVGAVDDGAQQSPSSESCAALLVSAPSSGVNGVNRGMTTTDLVSVDGDDPTDYTNSFGGTSAAAPVVSGVAALMLARNPVLTWRDVQHILVRTSRQVNVGDPGWTTGVFPHSEKYGFGVVDAAAAVMRAGTWTNVAAEGAIPAIARSLNVAIPDNSASGVSDTVVVDAQYSGFSVEHVEVEFSATHPLRGDLEVTLTSPSGVVSHLGTVRPNDRGANFSAWRFRSVRNWGETAGGMWKLTVADRALGSTGIWTGWTLRIFGVPSLSGGDGGGGGGPTPTPPADPTPPSSPVPGAPTSLVSSVVGRTVMLSWLAPAAGSAPTTYILEAGSTSGASDVIVYSTASTSTSYTATGVAEGVYFVRVRAANAQGTSAPSNETAFRVGAGGVPPPPSGGAPGSPSALTTGVAGSTATLAWNAPVTGGAPSFYVIEAGSAPGLSDLANFSTGNTLTSFSSGGVGAGTFFVRVRAGNTAGVSPASNEATLVVVGGGPTPCGGPPAAPSGLRFSVTGSTVVLDWTAARGASSYVVEAGSSAGRSDLAVIDAGSSTSLTAPGVGAGTYFVRIRAQNACGTGAASNEVVVVVR